MDSEKEIEALKREMKDLRNEIAEIRRAIDEFTGEFLIISNEMNFPGTIDKPSLYEIKKMFKLKTDTDGRKFSMSV